MDARAWEQLCTGEQQSTEANVHLIGAHYCMWVLRSTVHACMATTLGELHTHQRRLQEHSQQLPQLQGSLQPELSLMIVQPPLLEA